MPRFAGRRKSYSQNCLMYARGGRDWAWRGRRGLYVAVERSWVVRGPAPPYALEGKSKWDGEGGAAGS